MLGLIVVLATVLVPVRGQCGYCRPPPEYAVTVSASPDDPDVNHLAVVPGEFSVYLWMTCGVGQEIEGAYLFEAIVETEYSVMEFEPLNGWQNGGDSQTLLMVRGGCPLPPFLMGRWLLGNPQGVSSGAVCLRSGPDFPAPAPSCWVADCCDWWQFPEGDIGGVQGFAVGDAVPCFDDRGCVIPTALNPTTWGRVRARFRTPSN